MPASTVLDLLRDRHHSGSRPAHRSDGAKLALLIEGGGSRGTFSSGMTVAIEELGLLDCFDDVYGSSAGAVNGAWLLSRRAEHSIQGWTDPAVMRRLIDPRRALRGRPVVDTHLLVHDIYERVLTMDYAAVLTSPAPLHPLATDADTGVSTDLAPFIDDLLALKTALQASTSMPLLGGRPVSFAGRRFLDAGVSESVPVRTALDQGATHLVVLRTRKRGETSPPPGRLEQQVVLRYLGRHAPGAAAAWSRRPQSYAAADHELDQHRATLQIRPPQHAPSVSRTERDPALLGRAVELGRTAAREALAAISR